MDLTNTIYIFKQILEPKKVFEVNLLQTIETTGCVFISLSKKMTSKSTLGNQVFGVKVEVLLKEESTYKKKSQRLRLAVSLFFFPRIFLMTSNSIRLRTS